MFPNSFTIRIIYFLINKQKGHERERERERSVKNVPQVLSKQC